MVKPLPCGILPVTCSFAALVKCGTAAVTCSHCISPQALLRLVAALRYLRIEQRNLALAARRSLHGIFHDDIVHRESLVIEAFVGVVIRFQRSRTQCRSGTSPFARPYVSMSIPVAVLVAPLPPAAALRFVPVKAGEADGGALARPYPARNESVPKSDGTVMSRVRHE